MFYKGTRVTFKGLLIDTGIFYYYVFKMFGESSLSRKVTIKSAQHATNLWMLFMSKIWRILGAFTMEVIKLNCNVVFNRITKCLDCNNIISLIIVSNQPRSNLTHFEDFYFFHFPLNSAISSFHVAFTRLSWTDWACYYACLLSYLSEICSKNSPPPLLRRWL